jgi:hypothetical protein
MNPSKSPELWKNAKHRIDRLESDESSRAEIAPVLAELSEAFKHVTTRAISSDVFMMPSIWVLSMIGNEPFSVYGFKPSNFTQGKGEVEVYVAPHHDETLTEQGLPLYSRFVKLAVDPNEDIPGDSRDIEIFGLNLYIPNLGNMEDLIDAMDMNSTQKLVVVRGSQGIEGALTQKPISGTTQIFAVRNALTGMAKIYQVDINNHSLEAEMQPEAILREGEHAITFRTFDGRFARVEELTGSALREVIEEIKIATTSIASTSNPSLLTTDEIGIIQATLTGRFDSGNHS